MVAVQLLPCEYHQTSQMKSQYSFRQWLGAFRQQASTCCQFFKGKPYCTTKFYIFMTMVITKLHLPCLKSVAPWLFTTGVVYVFLKGNSVQELPEIFGIILFLSWPILCSVLSIWWCFQNNMLPEDHLSITLHSHAGVWADMCLPCAWFFTASMTTWKSSTSSIWNKNIDIWHIPHACVHSIFMWNISDTIW